MAKTMFNKLWRSVLSLGNSKNIAKTMALILMMGFFHPVMAERPTWDQEKQLFVHGTITDSQGKVWDVIYLPGSKNITKNAAENWKDAGNDFKLLAEDHFWAARRENVKDGLVFSRDSVSDYWLQGINDDYKDAVERQKTFKPGEIGGLFSPIVNWLWFGVKVVGRTITMPIGVAMGVSYSIIAPAVGIVWKPVVGTLWDSVVMGTAIPATLYVWNGVAWVASSIGDVPTRETSFVRVKMERTPGSSADGQTVVIDTQGFESIVAASVLKFVTDERKKEIQEQIQQNQSKIAVEKKKYEDAVKGYQESNEQLALDAGKENQRLNSDKNVRILSQYFDQALQGAKISMDPKTKEIFIDPVSLAKLVQKYFEVAGEKEITEEKVQKAVALIQYNISRLVQEMQRSAVAQQ